MSKADFQKLIDEIMELILTLKESEEIEI